MEGCFGSDAIPGQCQGRRPWFGTDADEPCDAGPRVVQRGASNIYFSAIESTLDIPPWSDELQKKIGMRWTMLEQAPDQNSRRLLIQAMRLSDITGKHEDELVSAIEDRIARLRSPDRNLRWEEYQQFVQHKQPFGENTEFEIRPAGPPPELGSWLDSVTRATRLREVRALRGFTRVFPPAAGDEDRIAMISLNQPSWLPRRGKTAARAFSFSSDSTGFGSGRKRSLSLTALRRSGRSTRKRGGPGVGLVLHRGWSRPVYC